MREVIEQTNESQWPDQGTVAEKIEKFLTLAFGCRHRKMSLSFTRGSQSYRTCVACGARRDVNLVRGIMVGPYYYPAVR